MPSIDTELDETYTRDMLLGIELTLLGGVSVVGELFSIVGYLLLAAGAYVTLVSYWESKKSRPASDRIES